MRVLVRCQEQSYSVHHILTEAPLRFEEAEAQQAIHRQIIELLVAMNRVGDHLVRLAQVDGQFTRRPERQSASLSDAFVLSAKSAARPGLALEG